MAILIFKYRLWVKINKYHCLWRYIQCEISFE